MFKNVDHPVHAFVLKLNKVADFEKDHLDFDAEKNVNAKKSLIMLYTPGLLHCAFNLILLWSIM